MLRRGGGLAERSELHGSVAELWFCTSASPQVRDESSPRSLKFQNTSFQMISGHFLVLFAAKHQQTVFQAHGDGGSALGKALRGQEAPPALSVRGHQ